MTGRFSLVTLAFVLAMAAGASRSQQASGARSVPDTMAQRALACTGCHGDQGRSRPEGYVPRIAGKPAGYLLAQLQSFRDGRRSQSTMSAMLQPLDDQMLAALADHFAGLKVPYPPPKEVPSATRNCGCRHAWPATGRRSPVSRLTYLDCWGYRLTTSSHSWVPGAPATGMPEIRIAWPTLHGSCRWRTSPEWHAGSQRSLSPRTPHPRHGRLANGRWTAEASAHEFITH